jgi:hypothetical protein
MSGDLILFIVVILTVVGIVIWDICCGDSEIEEDENNYY